jgi:hypothetical protein
MNVFALLGRRAASDPRSRNYSCKPKQINVCTQEIQPSYRRLAHCNNGTCPLTCLTAAVVALLHGHLQHPNLLQRFSHSIFPHFIASLVFIPFFNFSSITFVLFLFILHFSLFSCFFFLISVLLVLRFPYCPFFSFVSNLLCLFFYVRVKFSFFPLFFFSLCRRSCLSFIFIHLLFFNFLRLPFLRSTSYVCLSAKCFSPV